MTMSSPLGFCFQRQWRIESCAGRHRAAQRRGQGDWPSVPRRIASVDRHLLLVSGRASFEIVQKALAAGIPIIAAVSAPSTLAVSFARESNQTLIGFLRPPSFNIYAHIERVIFTQHGQIAKDAFS